MRKIYLFLLLLSVSAYAQIDTVQSVDFTNYNLAAGNDIYWTPDYYDLVQAGDDNFICVFLLDRAGENTLILIESTDRGKTWSGGTALDHDTLDFRPMPNGINLSAAIDKNGDLVVAVLDFSLLRHDVHYLFYDADYALLGYHTRDNYPNKFKSVRLFKDSGGNLLSQLWESSPSFLQVQKVSLSNIEILEESISVEDSYDYCSLVDDWKGFYRIASVEREFIPINDNENETKYKLVLSDFEKSTSAVASKTIYETDKELLSPQIIITDDETLWITFVQMTNLADFRYGAVFFMQSKDNGKIWTDPERFTGYSIHQNNYRRYIMSRAYLDKNLITYNHVKYGYAGISENPDAKAPLIINRSTETNKDSLFIKVEVMDNEPIKSVTISNGRSSFNLFDDGLHKDSLAGDSIFGGYIVGKTNWVTGINDDTGYITTDKINLPFDNKGVLADVNYQSTLLITVENISGYSTSTNIDVGLGSLGKFNDIGFLFSGGFFLSGFTNGELWTNGVSSAALVEDYQPGLFNSSPYAPENKIYTLTSYERPFSESWLEWKDAVAQGAYYYDGDKNGKYEPIDLNNNGYWDIGEDRPDLLYDKTFFCTYSDKLSSDERRFYDVEPQGIEIRQTIFASTRIPELQNTIFIRYSILNTGIVADTLNDVIFSIWVDPDIGDHENDLIGCDTTINSGFTYSEAPDEQAGENPPAFFYTYLQKPFIHSNYSTDTATIHYGKLIGNNKILSSTGADLIASTHPVDSPTPADPNRSEYYNLMLGKSLTGEIINPCEWYFGEVFNENCEMINPYLWYSGDPVTRQGWISTKFSDYRQFVSTGLFELVKDEPQDIIIAYTVGQGTDNISSITEARKHVRTAIAEYEANFPRAVDLESKPDEPDELTYNFKLDQNFPNPFNPSTTIQFTVPGKKNTVELGDNTPVNVKLVIYDVLGRRIETLIDEKRIPGVHTKTFNASQYASGVYFYHLTAGNFVQTKKMMLIK